MLKKIFAKIFASKCPDGKIDFSNLKSILINPIGTGIGDAIVLTGALGQLRKAYPSAKIGVICTARNEAVFANNPLQIEVVRQSLWYAATHRNKWQLYVDASSRFTTKGILFSFLLNFAYVICFEKEKKKYYNADTVKNYNRYIGGLENIHLSKLFLLTELKNFVSQEDTRYVLPPIDLADEAKILPFIKKDKLNVMVCPFGTTRQLDNREFKAIFKEVLHGNENKFHLLFPASARSAHYLLEDSVLTQTVLPNLTLFQWFGLIAQADLVVTVDSAAVHVAGAYQRPLVAFYGGQQPFTQFAPLPAATSLALVPQHVMPKNFNGTMKNYDSKDAAAKIKKLLTLLPLSRRAK